MSDNTEKVTGIGGIFFRVRDTATMSAWYKKHLGICAEDGHADFVWRENERPDEIGRTVWSIFPADTDHLTSPKMRSPVCRQCAGRRC